MLQPARRKFRKEHKGRNTGIATRGAAVSFGEFGLKATERGPEMVERGLAIGTSLAPIIGYDAAAAIVKEAAKTGKSIREVAREKTNLSEQQLATILDPALMVEPSADRVGAGGG